MSYYQPSIRRPTPDDVRRYASRHGMEITDKEANDFADLIGAKLGVLEQLETLPVEDPGVSSDHSTRKMGYRPGNSEDPCNAFVRRCLVKGADSGPLDGYDVGVKDNIAVGGIELTSGSKAFEGYVPSFDATVVTRLLSAGANVTGKTNLDEMAVSGSGEPTATGPILNPQSTQHLAGGSSGGSAAAVVEESVDIALGTDQAGSIRTPAAWCGCVGHKPTFSLVPYTGCLPGGPTYDHVGPMARTVEDCAKTLSVIAGPDGRDPRQPNHRAGTLDFAHAETIDYTTNLDAEPSSFTIGILEEGFGLEHSEAVVDETVQASLEAFSASGADITDVSVPWHRDGVLVWLGVAWTESATLLRDNGQGQYMDGQYHPQYLRAVESTLDTRIDEFAPTVRLKILLGEYLRSEYGGYYHAKAQNLRRELRTAYDDALAECDVLALPTTPTTAFEVEDDLTRKELVDRAQGKKSRTRNTMPFNMTGHPAITVPCGSDDEGLPVGLMLVGDRFDDSTVLAAASAIERSVGV